jgi:hypothetical protein
MSLYTLIKNRDFLEKEKIKIERNLGDAYIGINKELISLFRNLGKINFFDNYKIYIHKHFPENLTLFNVSVPNLILKDFIDDFKLISLSDLIIDYSIGLLYNDEIYRLEINDKKLTLRTVKNKITLIYFYLRNEKNSVFINIKSNEINISPFNEILKLKINENFADIFNDIINNIISENNNIIKELENSTKFHYVFQNLKMN